MEEKNWPELFARYLIVERGYSEKTKKAYQEDIQHFFSFLKTSGNDNYLTVEHLDVRAYLSELYDQEYSRNSISRKIASLRSFYQFLLKNEAIQENPFFLCSYEKETVTVAPFFL